MRDNIIPHFERASNVKIEYVVGLSMETLGWLQAQRNKPEDIVEDRV